MVPALSKDGVAVQKWIESNQGVKFIPSKQQSFSNMSQICQIKQLKSFVTTVDNVIVGLHNKYK
jgi:hypothetical protein